MKTVLLILFIFITIFAIIYMGLDENILVYNNYSANVLSDNELIITVLYEEKMLLDNKKIYYDTSVYKIVDVVEDDTIEVNGDFYLICKIELEEAITKKDDIIVVQLLREIKNILSVIFDSIWRIDENNK